MKRLFISSIVLSLVFPAFVRAQEDIPRKAAEAAATAAETAKHVGEAAVRHTKEAVETVTGAATPEPHARRVDVKLSEHRIDMPGNLRRGRAAIVVHNDGQRKHNFEIVGEGVNKRFMLDLAPGETKVLHIDLRRGDYTAFCPVDQDRSKGMETRFSVR